MKSKFITIFTIFCLIINLSAACAKSQAEQPNIMPSFADIAEKALPSVVNINTVSGVKRNVIEEQPLSKLEEFLNRSFPFFEPNSSMDEMPQRREQASGTGFVIDTRGYIVTNYHVINGADEVYVMFNENRKDEIKAEVVGFDTHTDLAVLKIEPDHKLTTLKFGDPNNSRVGDWILVIGNPFGFGGTVTSGIISAKSRSMQIGYNDLIQTDASINMGNSGGPMLNMDGDVIGVNRLIYSQTGGNIGIGFAISADTVKYVVESIKRDGKVARPWFGFYFQPIDGKIAETLELKEDEGVLIARVIPESPASEAGFVSGDIVTHIDGELINKSNIFSVMLDKQIGSAVELSVLRDGKSIIIESTPTEDPKPDIELAYNNKGKKDKPNVESNIPQDQQFGMNVTELSELYRTRFAIEKDIDGVIVESVKRGSAAYFSGIRPGMLVLSVNKIPTKNKTEFTAACNTAKNDDKDATLLLVYFDGVTQFIVMRER